VSISGGATQRSNVREIAERLVISAGTTHTHVVHIYEKAGVSTRAGVTLFALEHDLIARLIHLPA